MKRCIVCGNISEDSSTVCNVCGNPLNETISAPAEEMKEAAPETETPAEPDFDMAGRTVVSEEIEAAKAPEMESRPERRTESNPQIYGQNGQAPDAQMYAQQGMIRREVQGRPADEQPMANQNMQPRQPRPVPGQMQNRQNPGQMQGRPMPGQNPGQMQGRPMQGRPMPGQMQGRPVQGRPMPGQMQGRPMQVHPSVKAQQIKETSRKMLKSPLWLLIAIFFTANLAASIGSVFMNQLNYSQIIKLTNNVNLPTQFAGYFESAKTVLVKLDSGSWTGVNLVLLIPSVLFCIGLWLVFITAFAAKDKMSGIGFVFMKINVIISMITAFLVSLVVLVVGVAVVVAAWVSGSTATIVIAVVALVAIIVIVMMVIMYYFAYVGTLNTARHNSNTGDIYGKVSRYVAILNIILALFSIISLLSGIVNNEICSIVSAAGEMGWMILFGIWIMIYRGKLEEFQDR